MYVSVSQRHKQVKEKGNDDNEYKAGYFLFLILCGIWDFVKSDLDVKAHV